MVRTFMKTFLLFIPNFFHLFPLNKCGGQLYPVLKPRWKRPGPTFDLICMGCVRGGQAQRPI